MKDDLCQEKKGESEKGKQEGILSIFGRGHETPNC
jgi:hypothetical protein